MARSAPLWQQAGEYSAKADRQLVATIWPAGGASGGVVTANPNTMDVSVAPGAAAVPLTYPQGSALCLWDAPEVVTLQAAPPAGQTRVDLIVVQVRDADFDGGANNDFVVTVVPGVASALLAQARPGEEPGAEVDPFAAAAPVLPNNAYALATVAVPGAAANLNGATITDMRGALGPAAGRVASVKGPAAVTNCGAAALTVITMTFTARAGRRYRVSAFATGYQSAAANGNGNFQAANDDDATNKTMYANGAWTQNFWGSGAWIGEILGTGADRSVTIRITGTMSAGTLRVNANTCTLMAEDIGPV